MFSIPFIALRSWRFVRRECRLGLSSRRTRPAGGFVPPASKVWQPDLSRPSMPPPWTEGTLLRSVDSPEDLNRPQHLRPTALSEVPDFKLVTTYQQTSGNPRASRLAGRPAQFDHPHPPEVRQSTSRPIHRPCFTTVRTI
jgi:hypothetical protein